MNAILLDWLDKQIWPQIHNMMLNDTYFKLMGRAREITGEFNGPIAALLEIGYVTSQMLAVRRLCDNRRDVISLRRALEEVKANRLASNEQVDQLLLQLAPCDHICELANDYVAHSANHLRRQNVRDWNLQVGHLTEAQKAICGATVSLDRDLLQRRNYVKIIPVPQFDVMQEFKSWVPDAEIKTLWDFWHEQNNAVNAWIR